MTLRKEGVKNKFFPGPGSCFPEDVLMVGPPSAMFADGFFTFKG